MIDYNIYLITDSEIAEAENIPSIVRKSIEGGCGIVQIREKKSSSFEFYNLAMKLKEITKEYHIPLIVNDRVDIAMAIDADGVHIGQDDIPLNVAREILGKEKIIGVSAQTVTMAIEAENNGADYLGVGSVFNTSTKKDANILTLDTLKEIRKNISIPIVAIGGINKTTIEKLEGTGINGIAVVSAIMDSTNPKKSTTELKNLFKNISK